MIKRLFLCATVKVVDAIRSGRGHESLPPNPSSGTRDLVHYQSSFLRHLSSAPAGAGGLTHSTNHSGLSPRANNAGSSGADLDRLEFITLAPLEQKSTAPEGPPSIARGGSPEIDRKVKLGRPGGAAAIRISVVDEVTSPCHLIQAQGLVTSSTTM